MKKGNQWYCGKKGYIGVEAQMKVIHGISATPIYVHDVTEAHRLPRGGELQVEVRYRYQGVEKRSEGQGTNAV